MVRGTLASLFALGLGLTGTAVADPIVVESGAMVYANQTSGIHLEGQAFKLVSDGNFIDPTFFELTIFCSGGPGSFGCMPGDTVPLDVTSLGSDFAASVTLNGRSFTTPQGSETTRGDAGVFFHGEFTAPAFPGPL